MVDTMTGFMRAQSAEAQGAGVKVFDWNKAAKIIVEKKVKDASAGLSEDWEYTGGKILVDGKIPTDSYTFLSSIWAIPELKIDFETIPCYVELSAEEYGTFEWNAHTFWPDSAKNIMKEAGYDL